MSQFAHEEKLLWELEQLPGVVRAAVLPKDIGVFRVDVVVSASELDAVWGDLVNQVDAFERGLGGEAGLDLEVSTG